MKKMFLFTTVIAGVFAFTAPAHSYSFTYDLSFEFSGGTEPEGPAPWVTLTFDDSGTSGLAQARRLGTA